MSFAVFISLHQKMSSNALHWRPPSRLPGWNSRYYQGAMGIINVEGIRNRKSRALLTIVLPPCKKVQHWDTQSRWIQLTSNLRSQIHGVLLVPPSLAWTSPLYLLPILRALSHRKQWWKCRWRDVRVLHRIQEFDYVSRESMLGSGLTPTETIAKSWFNRQNWGDVFGTDFVMEESEHYKERNSDRRNLNEIIFSLVEKENSL